MEEDDIENSKAGIMENMRRIRDKADEVLELLLVWNAVMISMIFPLTPLHFYL